MTRIAISPRFATSRLWIGMGPKECPVAPPGATLAHARSRGDARAADRRRAAVRGLDRAVECLVIGISPGPRTTERFDCTGARRRPAGQTSFAHPTMGA